MEQTQIAILPARTRGLGRLGGIVGSLLRYVWLFLANSNQSRSAFIRTPNSYFICQFKLYLFVGIWQSFVFVYLCPQVDDNAADFSRSGGGGGGGEWGHTFPIFC